MDFEAASSKIAAAEDTADFLNHIGWEKNIYPRLMKIRSSEQDILTRMVLNSRVEDVYKRTKEELAGCVFGIDILIGTISRIVKDGIDAQAAYEDAISTHIRNGVV